MPIDLSSDNITAAITDAAVRGHTIVWGYIGDDGYASLSFRGSTVVLSPTQIGIWSRKRDDGIATGIAANPKVSGIYFEHGGPGPVLLTIKGLARVDASVDDAVFSTMPEIERERDPDKKGVAIVVDVEEVHGFTGEAFFQQTK